MTTHFVYTDIPVESLFFDPQNPRLPASVDAEDDSSVLDWMLGDAGLVELMGSIASNGFFPAEPLLVTPRDGGQGYWVLEGNRRLAAVRLLLDPAQAPQRKAAVAAMAADAVSIGDLAELPCAVFDSRDRVLDYLGFRHITGVKQWEPAAKARYLDALYREHLPEAGGEVFRRIARIIGSRSDYVSRLLASLRLNELIAADPIVGPQLEEERVAFSLVTLALSYRSIASYVGVHDTEQLDLPDLKPEHLRNLAVWIFVERPDLGRTQLGESHNMKLLAQAISHPEGEAALLEGATVEDAAADTVDADELFLRGLRQSRDRLLAAQSMIHRSNVTSAAFGLLIEIRELLDQIEVTAQRKHRRSQDV